MSSDSVIRHCHGIDEMHACVEVQRRVWGESDLEVIPATCFIVAEHTGGQVLGAFDGSELLGFTLAVPGIRDGQACLHSYMTAVLDGHRDGGIGRRLKWFQREDALSRGIRLVEWTFDPLETRNAHFNLDCLGAIARRLVRNMYGVTSSPLHRGLPTDRLLAEWYLDSPRVARILGGQAPSPSAKPAQVLLPLNWEELRTKRREEIAVVQSHLSSQLADWFKRGHAATGTSRSSKGFQYHLEPWPEVRVGSSPGPEHDK